MSNKVTLYIFLWLLTYIMIHSIIFYYNIVFGYLIEEVEIDRLSIFNKTVILLFMSSLTISLVLLPKFIYFSIIRFIFDLPIKIKELLHFVLIGYIPVILNTIIVNSTKFSSFYEISRFIRHLEDFKALGLIKYFDIIDTIVVIIISYLITKRIKGTFRDFSYMFIGWIIVRVIFFIIEVIIK